MSAAAALSLHEPPARNSRRGVGYLLQLSASLLTVPLDATTYFWGGLVTGVPSITAGKAPAYFPHPGMIRRVDVVMHSTTPGTAETSSLHLRMNDNTDHLISAAIKNDLAIEHFVNMMLGAKVAAGDFCELKWVTPTWVLNPASVIAIAHLYVE